MTVELIKKKEKNLLGFLKVLLGVTQGNINYILNKIPDKTLELEKYKKEIEIIQDLINSFDFVNRLRNDNDTP